MRTLSAIALLSLCTSPGCKNKDADGTHPDGADGVCGFSNRLDARSAYLQVEQEGCAGIVLDAFEFVGDGDFEANYFINDGVVVVQVTAGPAGGTLEALHASGTWWVSGDAEPRLLRQGYQSWSASGVFPLETAAYDADGLPVAGGDDGVFEVTEETPWTSWWVGLSGSAGGTSVALGALSARVTKFYTAFEADRVHAVWGGRGESIAMAPGSQLFLDPVWLAIGDDPNEMLEVYARKVVETVPPRDLAGSPPLTGWATWYQYYSDVSEADVRSNLDVAGAYADRLELLQIDDGWSNSWGDWSANERFPSGMGVMADEITAAGFRAGIWMAPFYVDRAAPAYLANDDWWVTDRDGVELDYLGRAVLDVTQPGASAWLGRQISDRVDEGYDYLKLDFLFAGAMEGQRSEDVTGMEAYQLGMSVIREAAGDAWILACGAPFLPSVGFAESFRTGPDIAFEASPDPDPAYLRNQVRYTAARGWTNGVWWWADPDQIIVRDPFDDPHVRGAVVANVVSGGVYLLGDDLEVLPADRLDLALNVDAMETRGARVVPQDLLSFSSGFDTTPILELGQGDDQVPQVWTLSTGETALLNLGTTAVEVDGPGGTELLSGETAGPGKRTLAAGAGEIWRP